MLILLPFIVIILIIAAINNIYYSDVKPKQTKKNTQVEKFIMDSNKTNNYVDKYIKK